MTVTPPATNGTIATGAHATPLVLTERERQLLLDLRSIDFWRAGKSRLITCFWNGVRAAVFDGQQIR